MTRSIPWVGHWREPWNRGVWDRCLWQIKWDNVMLRRRIRAGFPGEWW